MHTTESRDTISPPRWVARTIALLFVSACLVMAVGWLVGWLVVEVAQAPLRSGLDAPVLDFFHDLRSDDLTAFMKAATVLGGGAATVALLIAGGIVSFWVTRQPRWPIFFAGVILGTFQLYTWLKIIVDRQRPTLSPLYDIGSKAFPSGHAAAAAACFGALGYFALRRLPRPWAFVVPVLCLVVILLVGITRVYLGVHWPTDVLGGWALGGAWVAATALAVRPGRTSEPIA